jgi:hypothetical protein
MRPGLYQPRAVEGSTRRRHTHQREGYQLLARTSWGPQAQITVRALADVLPGDRHVVYKLLSVSYMIQNCACSFTIKSLTIAAGANSGSTSARKFRLPNEI